MSFLRKYHVLYFSMKRVWRYQRSNQNPQVEEGQTSQCPKWEKIKGQTTIYKKHIEHSFSYIIVEIYNINNRLIQFTCQLYHVMVIYLIIYINRRIHRTQRSVIYGIWCSYSFYNCCLCWNNHMSDVLHNVSVLIIVYTNELTYWLPIFLQYMLIE